MRSLGALCELNQPMNFRAQLNRHLIFFAPNFVALGRSFVPLPNRAIAMFEFSRFELRAFGNDEHTKLKMLQYFDIFIFRLKIKTAQDGPYRFF